MATALVTGKVSKASNATGMVTFTPTRWAGWPADGVVQGPSAVTATVAADGSFSANLWRTDDADTVDWVYRVVFSVPGVSSEPFYVRVDGPGNLASMIVHGVQPSWAPGSPPWSVPDGRYSLIGHDHDGRYPSHAALASLIQGITGVDVSGVVKVMGDLPASADLNTYTTPGVYSVPTATGKTNMPVGAGGTLEVIPYSGSAILQRFTSGEFTPRSYARRYTGSTWSSWRPTSFYGGGLPTGTDLNAATEVGTYNIQSTSHPNQPQAITGALEVLQASGALVQRFTTNTSRPVVYVRQYNGTTWADWRSGSWDRGLMSATTDVDTVVQLGAYGVQHTSQPNLPVARVGVLEVLPASGTVLQRFTSGDAAPLIYHRRWTGSEWTDWVTTPGPSEINDIATRVSTLEQSADRSAPVRAELGTWTPTSTSKNQAQIVTEYTKDRLVGFNGGDSSGSLRETRDNGDTWTLLHQFAAPLGWVMQLENGELLATTGVDPTAREVWLSSGYGKGGTVTWTKVLTAGGPYVTFAKAWSVSTYRNIVLLAEYGAKMPTYKGATVTTFARYVYMSLDYGKTWSTVFDLQDYLLNDRGVASADDQHLHGVAWDPYWDRIWVTFGDTTNGTVYSDDLGATWQTAHWGPLYSSGNQNVGILPMPKCILFGTDTSPNGVQRINRSAGKHSGTYTIEQAYTVPGDLGSLTHLCQAILKVDREGGDGPALFGFGAETQAAKSFIVGTYDGYDFKLLWMDPEPQPAGRGVRSIAGPNLRGELIVRHNDGRVANMWTELVGKAPVY